MDENEVVWPWGMEESDPDPASRPMIFNPQGFLVGVLEDRDGAERAGQALVEAGFAEHEHRIFTGEQVVDDRERFLAQQSPGRRLVGKVTSDTKAVELFLSYARAGRSFLWVRAPGREDANRAIRALSTHRVLHFRYYGGGGVEDIDMR